MENSVLHLPRFTYLWCTSVFLNNAEMFCWSDSLYSITHSTLWWLWTHVSWSVAFWTADSNYWTLFGQLPVVHHSRALHWSLSWVINPMHTTPSNLKSVLILSTHLHSGFTSVLLPSGFPTNNIQVCACVHSFYPPFASHAPPIISSLT